MLGPTSFSQLNLYEDESRSQFRWDQKTLTYETAQGRISPERLEVISSRLTSLLEEEMVSSTRKFISGTISLSEFQANSLNFIRRAYVLQASMSRGGWSLMTFADWGWVGSRIRSQYSFFRELISDVLEGRQLLNESLVTRLRLYIRGARATFIEMRRRLAQFVGATMERRMLSIAEHCKSDRGMEGCVELAARGWVPIGSLPPIGNTPCLMNCKCHYIFAREDGTEI